MFHQSNSIIYSKYSWLVFNIQQISLKIFSKVARFMNIQFQKGKIKKLCNISSKYLIGIKNSKNSKMLLVLNSEHNK